MSRTARPAGAFEMLLAAKQARLFIEAARARKPLLADANQAEVERVIAHLQAAEEFFEWFGPNAEFVRRCVRERERVEAVLGRGD